MSIFKPRPSAPHSIYKTNYDNNALNPFYEISTHRQPLTLSGSRRSLVLRHDEHASYNSNDFLVVIFLLSSRQFTLQICRMPQSVVSDLRKTHHVDLTHLVARLVPRHDDLPARQDGQLVLYGHEGLYRAKRELERAKKEPATSDTAN